MNIESIKKEQPGLIESSVLFRDLSDIDFEKALASFDAEIRFFRKGELLHRQYTEMSRFGMVISGAVQVCTDDIDGNRTIMAEVVPGTTFGESLCYLEIKNSPVYILAFEACEILWLSVKKLFSCNDDFSLELQRRFTAMLAMRTLSMNNRIQVLSCKKLRDKLMTYFNQTAQAAGSSIFTVPLNRDDLADYIGADRSALSRELSQMKKEGIIDYYKSTFRILDKKH